MMVESLVVISMLELNRVLSMETIGHGRQMLGANLAGELVVKMATRLRDANEVLWNRLESLLYCHLIEALVVAPPDPRLGHFWSLCQVFRCTRCRRLVPHELMHCVSCVESGIDKSWPLTIGPSGQVLSIHEEDIKWNLTHHVRELKELLNDDWRCIYWRLWSQCHYLLCTTCHWYYPVVESNTCRRHANNEPIFDFTDPEGISTRTHPVGRFVCCNAPAYRYLCVPQRATINGCKTVSHTPKECKSNNTAAISRIHKIAMLEIAQHNNNSFNNDNIKWSKNVIFNEKCVTTIWDKYKKPCSLHDKTFALLHRHDVKDPKCVADVTLNGENEWYRDRQMHLNLTACCGDIASRWYGDAMAATNKSRLKNRSQLMTLRSWPQNSVTGQCQTPPQTQDVYTALYNEGCCLPMQDVNADERFFNRPIQYTKRTRKHKKTRCGLQSCQWVSRFSTRFNQDRQREYENQLFHKLNVRLTKQIQAQTQTQAKMRDANANQTDDDDNVNDEEEKAAICWQLPTKSNNLTVANNKGDEEISSDDSLGSFDSSSSYCSTLKSGVRVFHSRTTAVWNSYTPLAGCYVRIETQLRETQRHESGDLSESQKQQIASPTNCLQSKMNARIHSRTSKAPTFTVQHSHYNRRFFTKSSSRNLLYSPPAVIKTKILEVPVLKEPGSAQESFNDIWSFDPHSQELDYLSAAYIPLPITPNLKHYKYYKTIKNQLSSQWSDLVDLEKSWVAFLGLFYETEYSPSKWFVSGGRQSLENTHAPEVSG